MDEQAVREHAQAHCAALVAGDVGRAADDLSDELRSNLGEVISQLPLPVAEATVESIERGGSGYVAILRLAGESETIRLQTRWKDRHGRPTIVEASRIAEPAAERAPEPGPPTET
jgi:hypothetical protein